MLLLPATITTKEARDTLRMLSQALQREPGNEVVVNASSLQQFDTSAVAVLLECQRLAQAWGKTLRDSAGAGEAARRSSSCTASMRCCRGAHRQQRRST